MTLKEALDALLDEFTIADYIYDVRARAGESGDGFVGNSWDHPKVVKFSEVIGVLQAYRKSMS